MAPFGGVVGTAASALLAEGSAAFRMLRSRRWSRAGGRAVSTEWDPV